MRAHLGPGLVLFLFLFALTIIAACAASSRPPATPVTGAPPPGSEAGTSASASASASGALGELPDASPATSASPASPAPSSLASLPAPADSSTPGESACNEQAPQDFLIRGNFLKDPKGNARAIQYRTDLYGYVKGFGHAPPDAQPPGSQLVTATFMGLPVKMHRRVAPVLACVQKEIETACAAHPYMPHALAGIRYRNTYRGGEITNHAYGIAIDVDPADNTCCGCVPPWSDAPACKRKGKSEYDHMAMPECWVHAFERFGFYWLGHDTLRDTMHFEFLGDPDRIVKTR